MLFNCIILALSVSLDSLGIGISYGIKNTKISKISNFILFAISFCITSASLFLGEYLSYILSEKLAIFVGSAFLIFLGIYGIYKTYYKTKENFDLDNSNFIDQKEAVFLGIALSIDSACVGIGSGIIGMSDIFLPLLVAFFQLLFINCGSNIAHNIITKVKISEKTLSIISSIILIIVGILRLV